VFVIVFVRIILWFLVFNQINSSFLLDIFSFAVRDMRQTVAVGVIKAVEKVDRAGKVTKGKLSSPKNIFLIFSTSY